MPEETKCGTRVDPVLAAFRAHQDRKRRKMSDANAATAKAMAEQVVAAAVPVIAEKVVAAVLAALAPAPAEVAPAPQAGQPAATTTPTRK